MQLNMKISPKKLVWKKTACKSTKTQDRVWNLEYTGCSKTANGVNIDLKSLGY
jgi:hypothetical protein